MIITELSKAIITLSKAAEACDTAQKKMDEASTKWRLSLNALSTAQRNVDELYKVARGDPELALYGTVWHPTNVKMVEK